MAVEIRTITEEELERYITSARIGFGGDRGEGEEDRIREVIGLDRTFAAFSDGRIVGTMAAYGLTVSVPGNTDLPAAGLTRVTVASTHRRRGILTAMMNAHFEDAVTNNEPLAVLWASELAIYGRYGYGMASQTMSIGMDSRLAKLTPPAAADDLDFVDVEEARVLLPPFHDKVRARRPGYLARSDSWWTHRTFADHEFMRNGGSSQRYVIARRDGRPVGYVVYRQKSKWDENELPIGTTHVVELVAQDPSAEHTLWSFLANIDLFPHVSSWSQPSDSIVPALADNQRAVVRRTNDGLMVRILDAQQALTARRYDSAHDLVLEITAARSGTHSIAGRYRVLAAEDGTATCEPTDAEADIVISTEALGAIYLGLVDHGTITGMQLRSQLMGSPEAIDRLRRCFTWPIAPWCSEDF